MCPWNFPHPRVARRLPRILASPQTPGDYPGHLGLPVLSIRGNLKGVYNPLIGIFIMLFRFDLLCMFGHHVRHSEVLWLERPVSQPGYQFPW
jgi:hypothetical protein